MLSTPQPGTSAHVARSYRGGCASGGAAAEVGAMIVGDAAIDGCMTGEDAGDAAIDGATGCMTDEDAGDRASGASEAGATTSGGDAQAASNANPASAANRE